MSPFAVLGTLVVSMLCASFFGYLTHVLMHQRWTGPLYRSHMAHHLEHYPPGDLLSDTYRKARWYQRGGALFAPFFVLFFCLVGAGFRLLGAQWWSVAELFGVMLCYGLASDWLHDSFHLTSSWAQTLPGFRELQRAHFGHHENMRRNFGILGFGWDRYFGTYREPEPASDDKQPRKRKARRW